jgi:hypothetical protein
MVYPPKADKPFKFSCLAKNFKRLIKININIYKKFKMPSRGYIISRSHSCPPQADKSKQDF